jgi:hypothetical protein
VNTHNCWLCIVTPGTLAPHYLQALCNCGCALQDHGYGHPHALAAVGCAAFVVALPLPPQHETDAQPALF